MEVTFRTAAAEAALLALKDAAIPGMCIGAGTVLTVEQAEAAIAAGSEFVISPGVNPEVVSYCVEHEVPVFPGIATPTDIQAAMNLGVDTLKFFPAGLTQPEGLKAMKAVLPKTTPVYVVGGVEPDGLGPWLSAGAAGFGIGSSLYKPGRDVAEVGAVAKAFVQALRGV